MIKPHPHEVCSVKVQVFVSIFIVVTTETKEIAHKYLWDGRINE